MKLTPEMLVLIAPCVLLAGVVLQLLLARVLTPRGKGILAVLSCLPSVGAVLAVFPLVRNGAANDLTPLQWDGPHSLALHERHRVADRRQRIAQFVREHRDELVGAMRRIGE